MCSAGRYATDGETAGRASDKGGGGAAAPCGLQEQKPSYTVLVGNPEQESNKKKQQKCEGDMDALYEVRCCGKDGEKVTMATSTDGGWDDSGG